MKLDFSLLLRIIVLIVTFTFYSTLTVAQSSVGKIQILNNYSLFDTIGKVLSNSNIVASYKELMFDKNANFNIIKQAFDNYWQGKTHEKGKGYNVFKRWEYQAAKKYDPSGNIGLGNDILSEYKAFIAKYPPTTSKSNTGAWKNLETQQPVGSSYQQYPGNGRVNFITFHPTNPEILFVGTPAGGVWKTINSGLSWTPISDEYAMLGASSLVINYNNPNIMYMATGDGDGGDTYSVGILKTVDGGATWTSTGFTFNTSQTVKIFKLLIDPIDPNKIFAACSTGLFLTSDGWNSYQTIFTGTIWDIEFKPGNSQYVYMTAWGGAFYRSTTGGGAGTWIDQSAGLPASSGTGTYRQAIAVSSANPAKVWFVGENYSNDGFYGFYTNTNSGVGGAWTGSSYVAGAKNLLGWAQNGTGTGGQGWYDLTIAVSQTDENCIYIGGVNLWKTTTGGNGVASWTCNAYWDGSSNPAIPYVHADHHGTEFYPGSGSVLYDVNDGGVFKSANNGTSWTDISSNLTIAQIYGIGGTQHIIMNGWQDDGVNKWDDLNGTPIWSHIRGGDGMDCMTDYTNDNIVYGSYPGGVFFRSTLGGLNWTTISPPPADGSAAWFTPICMHPTTNTTIFSATSAFYKSINSGTAWAGGVALPGLNYWCTDMAVAKSNPNYIYVSSPLEIWITSNGGTSFTEITSGLPISSGYIEYIGVSTNDPLKVWVTFSGFTAGNKVYYSANGGTNWTNVSYNLPNIPFYTIVYDPFAANDLVYAGGDFGVYYRDNTMSEWKLFNNSLPNVKISELEVYNSGSQATSKLRAATYGRGIWESDLYKSTSLDAEINDVLIPKGGYCGAQNVTPVVVLKNKGLTILTSATVSYQIDGSAATNYAWTGSLGLDGSAQISFPTIALASGNHTFAASVSSPNGGADGNNTNNSFSALYNVITSTSSLAFAESFDGVTFPPTNWITTIVSNAGTIAPLWTRQTSPGTTPAANTYTGLGMAKFNSYDCDANDRVRLVTPALTFFAKTGVTLTFWMYHDNGLATYVDEFVQAQISTDGINWINIGTMFRRYAAANGWVQHTVNLGLYDGTSCVYIGFLAQSQWGNNMYIDDINITGAAAACTPPSTQATNFSVTSVINNSMTLNWTRGNGNNVLIVARKGLSVDTDPTNGTSYTANSIFGSGQQIGTGNFVVYNGTGTSVSISNLEGNETYFFALYEYATIGTCYNKIELTGNATTLGPPAITTSMVTSILSTGATSGGNVGSVNGSNLMDKGVCWSTIANPTILSNHTSDIGQGITAGSFTSTISGLLSGTTYHVRAYATNQYGTNYGNDVIFNTICGTYYLNMSEGFNSSISPGCWNTTIVTNPAGVAPAISYVTLSSNATCAGPSEGTYFTKFNSYSCENNDQIRLVSPVINSVSRTNVTVLFDWFQDNGFNTSLDNVQIQYSTNGTVWNNVGAAYNRYNATTFGWQPKNTGAIAGAANQATLYIGFLFTSKYGNNCYLDNVVINSTSSICVYPTTQASLLTFSNVTPASMTVSCTRGNGNRIIILAKQGSAVNVNPPDGQTFIASSLFGSGQQLGIGNYIVYDGTNPTGNMVTVTNLLSNTTYYFAVYEYSTTGNCYKIAALTGNQATNCTVSSFPFNEGFEGSSLPACWSKLYVSGVNDYTYVVGNNSVNPSLTHSGNYNACLKRTSGGTDVTKLITPSLDISGLANPHLSFWYAQPLFGANQDELRVYYKTSAGGVWVLLGTYTSNITAWSAADLDLPAKTSDYYIAFEGTAKYGYGVLIDDILICNCAPGTWRGSANADWNTASNWCGGVPIASTNVSLMNGASYFPGTFGSNPVCASMTIESNASFTIPNGKTLSCSGNITNLGNFSMDNVTGANINLTGNWDNSGIFNAGQGTVTLNGSSAQTIGGSNITTFYNLILSNTSSTGVTLNLDANVSGLLTLTDGNINTSSSPSKLLTLNSSSSISGGSDASFICGSVRKVGSSAFTFPTGKNGSYHPISITAPSVPTDHFTAEYFYTDPGLTYGSGKDVTINHLSQLEYWVLDRTNGTSDVSVTLAWDTASAVETAYLSDLLVTKWDGISTWIDLGNSITTGDMNDGTIKTLAAVTSFSPFTFGSKTGKNPLPIELFHFDVVCLGNSVHLDWTTAAETNNDYFSIERSLDAVNWEHVAQIKGAGNSNGIKNYEYYDKNTSGNQLYYRLIQTDYDGKATVSNIVSTICKDNHTIDIYIYPNPAQTTLNVLFNTTCADNGFIYLFDELGKNVFMRKVNLNGEDINKLILDISKLPDGNYTLKGIFNKNITSVQKFCISK